VKTCVIPGFTPFELETSNREGDIEVLTFQSKPDVAIVIMVCRKVLLHNIGG